LRSSSPSALRSPPPTIDPIPALHGHVAWSELRATLARFLGKRVSPSDVDDVLQDVLLRIARGLPDLRDGDQLMAWVHQIARNAVADHHRRPQARREEPVGADGDADPPGEEDGDVLAVSALTPVLRAFVAMLSPPYREALEMTDLEGITQAEAASRVGLSLPGMKSRVQRARAQLRAMLVDCCDIELDVRGRIVDCEPRRPPAALPSCCSRERLHPSLAGADSMDMKIATHPQATETDLPATTRNGSSGCCGGPAPKEANACCALDADVKAGGGSGCGCGAKSATAGGSGCC
jgi:RNA polymerase sigma-70 factor (ECF subfamily)